MKKGLKKYISLLLMLTILLGLVPNGVFAAELDSYDAATEEPEVHAQAVEDASEEAEASLGDPESEENAAQDFSTEQENEPTENSDQQAAQSMEAEAHTGTTTATDVAISDLPGTAGDVVAVIPEAGTQVTVEQVVMTDDAIYYQVETEDEQAGYVRSDLMDYTMGADEALMIYAAAGPRRAIPAKGVGSYGGPNGVTGYKVAEKVGTGTNKTGEWYLDPDGTLYLKGTFRANSANSSGNAWPWQKSEYCNRETDIKRVVIDGSLQTLGSGDGSLAYMFWACRALESVDLTNFKTVNGSGKIINFTEMFRGCNALKTIEFGDDFDTSNVTNGMSGMFWNCNSLSSMDVSSWDTGKVTTMKNMFYNCGDGSLDLDMRNWTFKSGVDAQDMFTHCNLGSVDLSGTNLSKLAVSTGGEFPYIFSPSNGQKADGAKIGHLNLYGVKFGSISMNSMFQSVNIGTLDLTEAKTGNVTAMIAMFLDATIDTLKMNKFDFSNVETWQKPFENANIGTADLREAKLGEYAYNSMFTDATINYLNMQGFDFSNVKFGSATANMFNHGTGHIGTADLTGAKFGTSMYYMFANAAIDTLLLEDAKTENVTNMSGLFQSGVFEYIDFRVTQIGTGSTSLTAPSRGNMFNGAAFKKITFPENYADVSSSANFFSGTNVTTATYRTSPWAKIDDNGNVIDPYLYDTFYSGNGINDLHVVGRTNGTLAGTWIMLDMVDIQLVKVDEKGNSLKGSTFSVSGGYELAKTEKNETDIVPPIHGASVKVRLTGTYTVTETKVPDGYQNFNTNNEFKFKVKADGTVQVLDLDDGTKPIGVVANGSNLLVYNYPQEETVTVTKQWDDAYPGVERPKKITLKLYGSGGTQVTAQTDYDVKQGESQPITFKDTSGKEDLKVRKYDNSGELITYRVEEDSVPGYVTEIDDSDPANIVITNRSIQKTRDITVTVRWKEEDATAGAVRPESVPVTLKQGNKSYEQENVTLMKREYDPDAEDAEDDGYVYTFDKFVDITDGKLTLTGDPYDDEEEYGEWEIIVTGLPVYDENGNEYVYTLEQNQVKDYLTPLVDNDTFTIVNNHKAVITWLRPGAASAVDTSGCPIYTQQTDPDGPGDGITNEVGRDKMYDYVKSKYDPKDPGYYIPAKDAYWTEKKSGEKEGTADILISYREDPKNVFFLGSACDAHDLDSPKLRQELAAAAQLSDVDYVVEGVNYLGQSYQNGAYTVSGGSTRSVGPYDGTVNAGSSGDTLQFASGAHANVLAFAGDIVNKLGSLTDEQKPAQVVLSFDWGAWTACSAALEDSDWTKDMKLMRKAAKILQEYYEQGKVIWLASDGNVSGDRLMTFAEMDAIFGASNNRTREKYTNYLYPDSVQDFYDDPVPVVYTDERFKDSGVMHTSYRNGEKVTITLQDGTTKEVKPCTTYEFFNDTYTFTAGSTTMTNTKADDKAKTIDFFTMSKRIPFYQFALLNPSLFREVTTDSSVKRVPDIDEWLTGYRNGKQWRDNVPTAGYGAVSKVSQTMRDNFQGYDTITITDTLAEGLTYDYESENSAEVYYYTGDEAKGEIGSWVAVNSDNYTVTSADGKTVTAVINAKAADVCGKRVMLVLHTECDKIVFADNDNQPTETNDGNAEVETTASNVLDDQGNPRQSNAVSIASPKLRKVLPRAMVTATKTWVDDYKSTEAGSRPDVVLHLRAKYKDSNGEIVKSMTNDDILPAILITGGKNQSVIWGGFTKYEGFDVAQYNAAGENKTLENGKVEVSENDNRLSTKYLEGEGENQKTYDIEYEVWESAPDGSNVADYYLETELDKSETYNNGTDFEYKVVVYKKAANTARSLTVKKVVSGSFGNKNQEFDFTITLTAPDGAEKRTVTIDGGTDVKIKATGAQGDGKAKTSFEFGGDGLTEVTITCKLAHGENVELDPLPSGTEYTVSETPETGYTTTTAHVTKADNGTINTVNGTDSEISGTLAKSATVTFENKKEGAVPTGIFDSAAPGLAMIGTALALLAIAFVTRRRRYA